ncbi:hypothetical protein TNCV_301241 [Trichonephila clavipes]|nr:hypothetical protein TNCV_301241 [Trichonephila clavipes]
MSDAVFRLFFLAAVAQWSRIFQRLHRQLHETRSFHVTRHPADRRRAVRSPNLEENIINDWADRLESSTRTVAQHLSVSHQTVFRARKHLLHFQRVQALNPVDFQLPVGGTEICAAGGLHNSYVEQL